jgi:hypothetical protein
MDVKETLFVMEQAKLEEPAVLLSAYRLSANFPSVSPVILRIQMTA